MKRVFLPVALCIGLGALASASDTLHFTGMGYNRKGDIHRSDNGHNEYVYSGQIDVSFDGGAAFPTFCISTNRNISSGETWNVNLYHSVNSSWWASNQASFPQPGFNSFAYLADNYADNLVSEASGWSGVHDITGHGYSYTASDVAAALQLAIWNYSDPSATYATGYGVYHPFSSKVKDLTDWFIADALANAGAENWLLDVYQPTNCDYHGSAQTLIAPPSAGHPRFETPEPFTMSLGLAAVGLFVRRRNKK